MANPRHVTIGLATAFSLWSAQTLAQDTPVDVKSYPSNAELMIYDIHDPKYQRTCITPCKLELDQKRYLGLVTGVDYMNERIKGEPYWLPVFIPRAEMYVDFTKDKKVLEDGIFAQPGDHAAVTSALRTDVDTDCPAAPSGLPESWSIVDNPTILGADSNIRFKPIRRYETGHCLVRFNLTRNGRPTQIEYFYCTNRNQKQITQKSLEGSVYKTTTVERKPAKTCDIVEARRWNAYQSKQGGPSLPVLPSTKKMKKSIKKNFPAFRRDF